MLALGFFSSKFYVIFMPFSCCLFDFSAVSRLQAVCMYLAAIRSQRFAYDYVAHIPSDLDAAVLKTLGMGVEITCAGARSN